jgi:hypothetical protein
MYCGEAGMAMPRDSNVCDHRFCVLGRAIQSHLMIRALFCSCRLSMARPPLALGSVICGQAMRQCPPE